MQPPGTHTGRGLAPVGAGGAVGAGACLVVDAGRTRCRAALYAGDGDRPVGRADGPGLPGVADGDGSARPFAAALSRLVGGLSLPARPLDAVCVGMTGVLRPGPAAAAVAEAVQALLPARRVLVTSDVVTGYCGAVGLGPGVVVAAGSGMIALAAGPLGVARVDGWGYLLGDAGSGFEIGRRGLAAALRAHDGRGGSALLAEFAMEVFGPLDGVVEAVYGAGNPVGAVAAFAAKVAEAARRGDPHAAGIWADAATEVADTALAAAARALGPAPAAAIGGQGRDGAPRPGAVAGGESLLDGQVLVDGEPGGGGQATLSWTGGLFDAADLLLEPVLARIAAARPELAARPPLGSALVGGYRLTTAPPGHPLLELVHVAPEQKWPSKNAY
jgi:glucosamine kinase